MKSKTIEMPEVAQCEASECAYNAEQMCHARAITIGESDQPMCDTACNAGMHIGAPLIAGVGACKVAQCQHNNELECQADTIQVGLSGSDPTCMTFATR